MNPWVGVGTIGEGGGGGRYAPHAGSEIFMFVDFVLS